MAEQIEVTVRLGRRSYPVVVARGLLDEAGRRLADLGLSGKAVVVTQHLQGGLFGRRLEASLRRAGFEPLVFDLPEGEEAKSLAQAAHLWDFFAASGLDRWSTVVALGGGAVGDAAGFAAGTYMRGVPFVQVPTTLTAQVDSSIGGKTALNLPVAKNIVGVFHQPRAVLIDPGLLDSLPEREMRAGFAEVVRYAAIADARFFAFLERELESVLDREPAALLHAIGRSAAIKASIVSRDEREEGDVRALLNYGHTVGHAVEAATGYGLYRHGEAVAMGMAVAARLAHRLGVCSRRTVERQINLLRRAGLPVTLRDISADMVLKSLMLDKKIKHGRTRFVLTERVGRARVFEGLETALILEAMNVSLNGRETD